MYRIHIFQLPSIIFIRTCTGNNTITEHCLHGVCMSYDEINRMRIAETYTGRGEGVGERTNYTCFIQKPLSHALCDGSQYISIIYITNAHTTTRVHKTLGLDEELLISRHSNGPMGDWTKGKCSLFIDEKRECQSIHKKNASISCRVWCVGRRLSIITAQYLVQCTL